MKSSDPTFFPGLEVDESKRREMDSHYQDSINILQTQWSQADLDQRFVLGDQDIWGMLFPGVSTYRRKMFNFNMINTMVQMVSGYQRRNRKSSICIPIHAEAQRTADQMTKCLYAVHKESGAYQVYSDAFEQGALTQGIGLVSIFQDNSNDPSSGDIKMRYVDFKSVLIDPYFRRHDLSDCRYIWTRQFFDKKEAAQLYPQFEDEIMNLPRQSSKDDRFYYMPEVYQIQFPNLVAFDEYWYLSSRQATYLVDTLTNETQEWIGDEEDFRILRLRFGEQFKLIKRAKQTVRRTIMVNDRVLVDEPNPYGLDRYPYVPFLGYFTPDTPYYAYKFKGIVRDMRDAQYLFNRRKVADLDILESQQQGIKVKKGTLVSPEDGLNQGNGRMLVLKESAQMSDVEPMPIIPPAPTMLQMEEMLRETMGKISGINEELLGSAADDKAGILSMLRQGAGLTTLQRLFDQFDESQRLCGDIVIEMIQKNWTYNKVKQVIGEDPTEEFDNKAFFKYGCKVVQGVLTETQHQLELGQLLELQNILGPNTPPPVIDRIIDAMYIQNKDELKEQMGQFNQAKAQQEQQMSELQMQQMQIDNETKLSYAQSQQGLAAERVAKIQTDKAVAEDKLRRAEEEDTASLLNLVKTIKELQSMDTTNLMSKIAILDRVNSLNFEEKMEREQSPGSQL